MLETHPSHYVVGVGASAGGLQAVTQLLSHLPPGAPLSVVVVQHLDREYPSSLAELLAQSSKLPVSWIEDGMALSAGRVFVLPPSFKVSARGGSLILETREDSAPPTTIDYFFGSLAEEFQERAVGVILSGSGSDGVVGARAIRGAGGFVYVQSEGTASFPEMPKAAIDDGAMDRVLPPEEIASELAKLAETSREILTESEGDTGESSSRELETWAGVFRVLLQRKGVDFSDYKQSTIRRRLLRRMVLAKTHTVADYLHLLLRDPPEVEALYEDLLINVTSFFRDPEYFDFLRDSVLPTVVRNHADRSPIRIWVPGCSTGHEAYSLAILVNEALEAAGEPIALQIFGTDISDTAIDYARVGRYRPAELAGMDPERLRRWFLDTPSGYVVNKSLRNQCVFARQNVTKDPPFSRLDLVSCRNLLIYLGQPLQKKLMPIFHYALVPGGYLVLGTSESVGGRADLFRLVDRRYRVYSRKAANRQPPNFEFAYAASPAEKPVVSKHPISMPDEGNDSFDIMREADRVVLGRHAPPGVLVNEDLEILQFRGNVSRYLSPLPGRASLTLSKMAAEGLASELEAAVQEARQRGVRLIRSAVHVVPGEGPARVDIDVTPINPAQAKERFYLILFVDRAAPVGQKSEEPPTPLSEETALTRYEAQIVQLKHDLEGSRNYLQSVIEKHEIANQELRAANEEIQSSNEELQSTNEELETAKEELQSTNEELTVVNEELHGRQMELIHLNNDLNNLINSVHLPIIILGRDLQIRRFTPMAESVLNVIPTDIGRPLSDLNISLKVEGLSRMIAEVMDTLAIREMEVQNDRGRWYSMRLRPYQTSDNKIEGVVMTLIDINDTKQIIQELERTRVFAFAVTESFPDALVAMSRQLNVHLANEPFHRLFGLSPGATAGQRFFDLLPLLKTVPEAVEGVTAVASGTTERMEVSFRWDVPAIGQRTVRLSARLIRGPAADVPVVLATFRVEKE